MSFEFPKPTKEAEEQAHAMNEQIKNGKSMEEAEKLVDKENIEKSLEGEGSNEEVKRKIKENGYIPERESINLRIDSVNLLSDLPEDESGRRYEARGLFNRLRPRGGREFFEGLDIKHAVFNNPKGATTKVWSETIFDAMKMDISTGFMGWENEKVIKMYEKFLKKEGDRERALLKISEIISQIISAPQKIESLNNLDNKMWSFIAKNKENENMKIERDFKEEIEMKIEDKIDEFVGPDGETTKENLEKLSDLIFEKICKGSEVASRELGIYEEHLDQVLHNKSFNGDKKLLTDDEFSVIEGVGKNPESILKNYKQFFQVLARGLSRAGHIEGSVPHFNYDIAFILGKEAISMNSNTFPLQSKKNLMESIPSYNAKKERDGYVNVYWNDIDDNNMTPEKFKKSYTGIICLMNNEAFLEQVKNKMLEETKDNPELRMPIYTASGQLYWPEEERAEYAKIKAEKLKQ